ncbi:MAG: hypothetical protein ABID87_02115 [Chloroflexota bacterium]
MVKANIVTRDGLPQEAFAVVEHPEQPETWHFPHHKKSILRALRGKAETGDTVDWNQVETAITALRPGRYGRGVGLGPEAILAAARHLAEHYRNEGEPLPDVLAALV